MQTLEATPFATLQVIRKSDATAAKDHFLRAFSHVPDDRLAWKPESGVKSAIQIAAHLGLSCFGIAEAIRGVPLEQGNPVEALRQMAEKEAAYTDRDQVVRLIEDGTAKVVEAIEALTPELLESEVMSPFGSLPMRFWVKLPTIHAYDHLGQIEYLQTMWGDHEPH